MAAALSATLGGSTVVGAGAGANGPSATIMPGSRDDCGKVTVITGTTTAPTATGTFLTITLAANYTADETGQNPGTYDRSPVVTVTFEGDPAYAAQLRVLSVSGAQIVIKAGAIPAAGATFVIHWRLDA